MNTITKLFGVKHPIFALIIIVSCIISSTSLLLEYTTFFFLLAAAYTDGSLTIKHDIQTVQQVDGCVYSISVLVMDSDSKKPLSDAIIEFQTNLQETLINSTDHNGTTEISLVLDRELGKTCMEILLAHGYSLEASREGYPGLGTGTIS